MAPKPMMKRCYLVRHAQTVWNGENRLQGHSDQPLSPLGRLQAERVGRYFSGRRLQGVFTSRLSRSRETAEAITTKRQGPAPIIEQDLAEIHLGAWEGLTPEEIDAQFPGAYAQWKLRPSAVAIPGAEPMEAFRVRVRRAFQQILARVETGECVIVSHGGVIALLLADVLHTEYDAMLRRLRLDNAGITALDYGGELPHAVWINGLGHLEGLPPIPPGSPVWQAVPEPAGSGP